MSAARAAATPGMPGDAPAVWAHRGRRPGWVSGRVIELPGALPALALLPGAQATSQDTLQASIEVGKVEMAQKIAVTLEDDLTGGPAEQTVRFAFDGTDYEIDLNAKNAAAFSKQLAPYLEHARRAGRAQPHRSGRAAAGRQRSGDIRAWAKEHGLQVSERGRIPASVAEQYRASANGR